jgi:general secretion pathway protein D
LNTSKSLWHFVAFALVCLAPASARAAADYGVHLMIAGDSVAQLSKSQAKSDRQQAEKLMAAARSAMKQGDWDQAESLTATVEKLNPHFGPLHFGDTPRKLRADLKASLAKNKQPERPSQKFAPEVPQEKPATAAVRRAASPSRIPTEVIDPSEEKPLAMPQVQGQVKPLLAPLGPAMTPSNESPVATRLPHPNAPATTGVDGSRRQADYELLTARRALAVGDLPRATAAVEAAKKLGVNYGFHDDSPEKVEATIRRYQQVTEAIQGRDDEGSRRQMADLLMDQAQQLMRWRDFDEADRLVQHATGMKANYGPFDVKPEALSERIAAARQQAGQADPQALPASGLSPEQPLAAEVPAAYPTTQAVYEQSGGATRERMAAAQEELPPEAIGDVDVAEPAQPLGPEPDLGTDGEPLGTEPVPTEAMQLYGQGEQALRDRDTQRALGLFRKAYELRDQLDPSVAQRLQDHLQLLSAPPAASRGTKPEMLLDAQGSEQALLARQISNDLAKQEMAADKAREKRPTESMKILKEARAAVDAAGLDTEQKGILLRRVDRKIAELDKYIIEHRAEIELDEKNREILAEVDRRLETKLVIDDKLAQIVDDCNRLMDEQRFAEAEVLAKRARELDPDNPVVKQLVWQTKFVNRVQRNNSIREQKEEGYYNQMTSAEEALIPFDDQDPYRFGDARSWEELTKSRSQRMAEHSSRRNERELEIERQLQTPVSLKFRERPLSEVLEYLATLAAVNLHLDPKGLEEEGVSSDTPVTIDLSQEISLKSALNLILEPLRLSYVIQNEVLKITSEQLRDTVVVTKTYDVADLVIPIPNFSPSGRWGLSAAIAEGYNMTGTGVGLSPGSAFVASQNGTNASGTIDPAVLAQINQLMPGGSGGGASTGMNQPISMGPGGMGGGAQADFDSLIELITTTVKPQTWDEVGGPGSVSEFQNNLSLVISQTEDVHEEIVDLLEQLRRNQDLQVTIEVRFITLSDTFFERIGVDFDFNVINTSALNDPNPLVPPRNKREIIGLNQNGQPTADLGIPFQQESFALAVPQFGTPVPVASFGFAILSDLEAFLLVQAAQGDRRSNVLQAPKVTLFNGQQASVFDQTAQPFVISVIPVVGDFAAAYQPVITVLSQGTALTVQAVISHDRRFVRLTVLPLFTTIEDVQEFRFTGSTTTTENTSESESTGGSGGDSSSSEDDVTTTTDGVTVQLPNFSFVSVVTTVSVPDGGTVLLGGIKRLSEGRNEFGVPILSKLPYINRLFKNVGIGRETQSLMMMVTPRIIIQEEEEERLGLPVAP